MRRFFLLDGSQPQDDVGMVFARSAERGKAVREQTVQPNENLELTRFDGRVGA